MASNTFLSAKTIRSMAGEVSEEKLLENLSNRKRRSSDLGRVI